MSSAAANVLRPFVVLQRQARGIHWAGALALMSVVSVLDTLLDRDLAFYSIYCIPILYATWFLGLRWGYAGCAASIFVWMADEFLQTQVLHRGTFASLWNPAARACVLVLNAAIISYLKNAVQRNAELETRERELSVAREVQLRLLPASPLDYPGLDIACHYRPAEIVGGDYYDFIPLSPTQWAFAVGDVSGKGLPSALLMASLQGFVRNIRTAGHIDLAKHFATINTSLLEITESHRYATLLFGVLDTEMRTLDYINGGHNPPLLFRKNEAGESTAESLNHAGPPVGLLPRTQYESHSVALRAGDVLAIYTDGVTEARNEADEEFGEERLRAAIQSTADEPPAHINTNVRATLDEFTGDQRQFDDVTLMVLKLT